MPSVRGLAVSPPLRTVNVNDLALNTTLYYAADLSYTVLDLALSSALFAVLTLLVIIAVIFLFRRGFKRTPVRVLLPSTLLLYGSTALYMASLGSHVTSVNSLVSQAQGGLFSDAYTDATIQAFEGDVLMQSWMMTIALAINLLVGDSIVWWRACAVWRTRTVYCLGPLLIALSLAFCVKALSGVHSCVSPCRQPQMLLPDGFFVDACAVLSLAVNVIATMLIGLKAWEHRKLLAGRGRRKSRALWALALLVESGTIYCILLILVIVYEVSPALFAAPDVHQSAFLRAVADYTYACFVPIIVSVVASVILLITNSGREAEDTRIKQAIYPVLIIVIVALNWSPIEHALTLSDATSITGEDACPATSTDFNGTTMSTVLITDTIHTQCIHDGEDNRAREMEAKRRPYQPIV